MLETPSEQHSLFDDDPQFINGGQPARHSWLWGGALIMRTAVSCPTYFNVMSDAVDAVRAQGAKLNRGSGELVEAEMATLLDQGMQAQLSDEIVAALPGDVPGFGTVHSLSWEWLGGGRQRADFLVTIRAAERNIVAPANVKISSPRHRGAPQWSVAAALTTVLMTAMGEDLRSNPPRNRSNDGLALDWCAGTRRIVGGDYYLLSGQLDDNGALLSTSAQGLLSTVIEDDGVINLAIRRHRTRPADVLYRESDRLLPAGFDVNAAFARALLPPTADLATLQALEVAASAPRGATAAQLAALVKTARAQTTHGGA